MVRRKILFTVALILFLIIAFSFIRNTPSHPARAQDEAVITSHDIYPFSQVSSDKSALHFFITSDGTGLFQGSEKGTGAVEQFIRKNPRIMNDNVQGVASDRFSGVFEGMELFPQSFENNITVMKTKTDADGKRHIRYRQMIQGFPVFGSSFSAHLDNKDRIYAVSGAVLSSEIVQPAQLSAVLASERAIAYAQSVYPQYKYAVMSSQEVLFNGNLIGLSEDDRTHRAVDVVMRSEVFESAPYAYRAVVSRTDGTVLYFESIAKEAVSRSVYDCTGGLTSCPLVRVERSPQTGVADVDNTFDYLGDIYRFYETSFARDSYDNAGSPLTAFVNLTTQMQCPNAVWFKDPYNHLSVCESMATQDILAHEVSHGVIAHTAGMISFNQQGALDEAFADIFAYGVDQNWTVGEGSALGQIRDARNPPADRKPHPDRLFSPLYVCSSADNGGIHSNMTVITKGFYLMSEGGQFNGCNLVGIGMQKSHQIWYRALTTYLNESSNFAHAYSAILQSCVDLYGATSPDCARAMSALQAVELDQQIPAESVSPSCLGLSAQPATCAYTPITPTVSVTQPACGKKGIGDANCDNQVNLLDFETWRREYLGLSMTRNADFDGDGAVSLSDFQNWRTGYFTN